MNLPPTIATNGQNVSKVSYVQVVMLDNPSGKQLVEEPRRPPRWIFFRLCASQLFTV